MLIFIAELQYNFGLHVGMLGCQDESINKGKMAVDIIQHFPNFPQCTLNDMHYAYPNALKQAYHNSFENSLTKNKPHSEKAQFSSSKCMVTEWR